MPALYAHNRFGGDLIKQLDGELQTILKKYYTQFRIGMQGPDPFFFYRPIFKTYVSKWGSRMHEEEAKGFFEKTVMVIEEKGRNSREYAYILGFICHFALDSECHPYVEQMVERIGVGHMEIEGEFDKYLLRADKKDALAYPIYKYLPTDDMTVETMFHFFPKLKREEIKESLKTYRLVKKVFTAPSRWKQAVINSILKLVGVYNKYYGLMHTYDDNPKCEKTNRELEERYQNAILVATKLIESYDRRVKDDVPLSERFERTYD